MDMRGRPATALFNRPWIRLDSTADILMFADGLIDHLRTHGAFRIGFKIKLDDASRNPSQGP